MLDAMGEFMVYELGFWLVAVAISITRYDMYYAVTSLSIFAVRLHCIKWPFARFWIVPRLILLVLVIWCCFLSPTHVYHFTLMDLFASYSAHPLLNPVEVLYDPGENAVVDFYAIHGLGSNPDSAWTYRHNPIETRWLKDILPKESGFADIRIVMVNHQTQ
ncbi:hypothetical protein F4777DRAFT_560413 [Nemania sp. FL0916]|nr:hypothetical protein F4777DRAFT_560413 [Nemania sp. FL0916]